MTDWCCYPCVKDGLTDEIRQRHEAEGLTIVNGTLTCVYHVRSNVRSAEMLREAEVASNRAAREGRNHAR